MNHERIYLSPDQLSARWGVSGRTLANLRCEGKGLRYAKLGRAVRYELADVDAYETARLVEPSRA